jgi:class 3 adenylate cyclase
VRRVRDEVVGERRIVTVLFADAEGFTRSAERVDEELVYAFMRRCLAAMTAAVHGRDGTVTPFRGDGIMALFGAPLAEEDAAVKAVLAALDMRERLPAGRAVGSAESTMDCRFRIGLLPG